MECARDMTATTGAATQIFATAFNFFAASQCLLYDNFQPDLVDNNEKFDFIVVGGGSAGSVVANRLSEVKHWNVLLLEAGVPPPLESIIPNLDVQLFSTKYDWNYYTEHNTSASFGSSSRKIPWPRGKMLGGCSAINGMVYIKGKCGDFQNWVDSGNPSWTPENVMKYYKKAEGLQSKRLLNNPYSKESYGSDGPLIIDNYNSTYREYRDLVLNSWDEIGFKKVFDINTPQKVYGKGFSGIFPATVSSGRRQSTYEAYIKPIRSRENLKVLTNAYVTKVLIDETDGRAYGVEADVYGKSMTFYASREVILSAGTVNTPQLLMLSGIGPKNYLNSMGIPCVKELPVGKNLQDHYLIPIFIYGDSPGERDMKELYFEEMRYLYDGKGHLGEASFSDITAFFSRYPNATLPEFQSHFVLLYKQSKQSGGKRFKSYKPSITTSLLNRNKDKAIYIFTLHLLHPFSKGEILIKSSNPYDDPIIDSNYLNDPRDLEASVDGLRMLTGILNSKYFKSINAQLHKLDLPECEGFEFQSELYWKCYANNMVITLYHPVGTAKMGPDPSDSVVDNNLRVHGLKGLRVIDASIMPSLTSGNTNGPTIMIGEMGSDMIKADHAQ